MLVYSLRKFRYYYFSYYQCLKDLNLRKQIDALSLADIGELVLSASKLMELIRIMLTDILSTTGNDLSIDFLLELMFNRNEFINTMAKLKN
jgi:hypothetical protein